MIEQAAQHNLSVMVEKPLTISLDDALAIRRAATAHNIQVLVNYETTWYSSNKAVYDLINQGKLGDVRKVVVHDGHEGPKEINVQPEFLKWLTNPATNPGALYDFGCYGADLMTWWMHGKAPISVTAVAQTDKPAIYPDVNDDATIILQYPGVQAVLMPSWNWTFSRKDSEIYGNKGYAITVGLTKLRIRYVGEKQENEITSGPTHPATGQFPALSRGSHEWLTQTRRRPGIARHKYDRDADPRCSPRVSPHRPHREIKTTTHKLADRSLKIAPSS